MSQTPVPGLAPPPHVTAPMVREALAHCPIALVGYERFAWIAERLDRAIREPDHRCPCCGVPLSGDTAGMDPKA